MTTVVLFLRGLPLAKPVNRSERAVGVLAMICGMFFVCGLCLAVDAGPGPVDGETVDAIGTEPRVVMETCGVQRCNVCGSTSGFTKAGGRRNAQCPVCGARERHRLLLHYLEHEAPSFAGERQRVLHFSPNRGLKHRLEQREDLDYVTTNLFGAREDLTLDITNIDQPDRSWDVVIAYHVLEHVLEDEKAMRELFRILRPSGVAILQVPLWPTRTEIYEDRTIIGAEARAGAFGQGDHVRIYSAAGFRQRLEHAGFEVEVIDYAATVSADAVARYGLLEQAEEPRDSRIWVAKRPPSDAVRRDAKQP